MKLRADQTVIVFLGLFNPRLFHPAWMHEHGVLTDTEAEAALEGKATEPVEVPGEPQPLSLVVTEEVSQTAVLGLQITVQSSRLSIHGLTQERHERAFEVAVALQKLVPHSPTHSMGFNRNFVLEIGSEEAWHRIGHTIIQKNDFWLAWISTRSN